MRTSCSVFLGVGLIVLLGALPPGSPAAAERPNVLLITIDTLRADRLACYGYKAIRTPHIDRLAAEGVRFEQAYTPVPITLPAHAALFTGKYPMATGMHDFNGNQLTPTHPTLAALFQKHGYATAGFVGAAVLDSRFGLNRGFTLYYDNFSFDTPAETPLDAVERRGDQVVDEALAWLRQRPPQPFFLWVHLYDPHHPYRPPPPFDSQYRQEPYDGEVAFADAQVGRLLQFLQESKLYERTAIALTADHGESLGEHGEETHGFFLYSSTRQIPLILKLAADQTSRTKVVSSPVSLVDLMPTLLRAAGLSVPAEVQGKSLLSLLQGQPGGRDHALYAETLLPRIHFNWSELRSIQVGNYHYIEAPRPELYDLSTDPGELRNLAAQKKTVAKQLQARLNHLQRKYSAASGPSRAARTALDPKMMEMLQSLGYVAASGGAPPPTSSRHLPDPKDRIEMYQLITHAFAESQQKRYDASNAKLQAALKIEPDSPPVHFSLALNYYNKKDIPAAIETFRKVLQLRPDYPLAAYYLGLAYARADDWEQAIGHLRLALETDTTNFWAAFRLGGAYLKVKKYQESIAAFRQAATIYPEFPQAHLALGTVLLDQGQLDPAIQALRQAVRLVPEDGRARLTLAKALDAKGLREEAEQERSRAQSLRPEE